MRLLRRWRTVRIWTGLWDDESWEGSRGGRKDIVSGSLMKVTDLLLSLGLMLQYYSYVAVS